MHQINLAQFLKNKALRCYSTTADLLGSILLVVWRGGNGAGRISESYATSGPVSTGMGDRLRVVQTTSVCNQLPRPT